MRADEILVRVCLTPEYFARIDAHQKAIEQASWGYYLEAACRRCKSDVDEETVRELAFKLFECRAQGKPFCMILEKENGRR